MRFPWQRKPQPIELQPSAQPQPVIETHEYWCDTNMPSAARWAAEGMPFRCNCGDTGLGSFRAVLAAFDQVRAADERVQAELGIRLPSLPDPRKGPLS